MTDIDMFPELLRSFALEWEADINRYGDDQGPEDKIIPRDYSSRETTKRRIAFMRQTADEIERLRRELAEARAEVDEANHALVDKYREPKSGTFSFPADVSKIIRLLERERDEAWNAALDAAAEAVGKHDCSGREWSPDSFWGQVTNEAVGRITALRRPASTQEAKG